ncbi:unnamed protein product (mitochondrion) [Plasmodiophora brassicae]|uniref:Uncharacterized protein n=1 Tax=Plasmodiophora brassicae TaxID=37360 RepID=A0A3P3XYJ8_PLABS|nr:unnamed protein product [Plasmodiophora brassicae]
MIVHAARSSGCAVVLSFWRGTLGVVRPPARGWFRDVLPTPPMSVKYDARSAQAQRVALYWFYFSLGVNLTLPALPIKMILMDELQCEPSTLALLNGLSTIPWIAKPLYALMSDHYPLLGYRRVSYIALGLVGHSLACAVVSIAGPALSTIAFSTCLVVSSFCLVVSDAAINAYVVGIVKEESDGDLGRFTSSIWTAQAIGSILSAAVSGFAMEYGGLSPNDVMLIASGVAVSGLLSVVFIPEQKVAKHPHLATVTFQFEQFMSVFQDREIARMSAFVLLFSAMPSQVNTVFFFMRSRLKFSSNFLSMLTIASHFSYLIGSYVFGRWLRAMTFADLLRRMLWCNFATTGLDLILALNWNRFLLVPDWVLALASTLAFGIFAQIAFMPIAIIAARIAPKGSEGDLGGGLLTDVFEIHPASFRNLPSMVAVCAVFELVPLAFLPLLPDVQGRRDDDDDDNDENTRIALAKKNDDLTF